MRLEPQFCWCAIGFCEYSVRMVSPVLQARMSAAATISKLLFSETAEQRVHFEPWDLVVPTLDIPATNTPSLDTPANSMT